MVKTCKTWILEELCDYHSLNPELSRSWSGFEEKNGSTLYSSGILHRRGISGVLRFHATAKALSLAHD